VRVRILVFLSAAVLLPTLAAFAQASRWQRITDPPTSNTDQVAVARTGDGMLHVVWKRKDGRLWDYIHTSLNSEGNIARAGDVALTGWDQLSTPALVATANGGLRLLFGGVRGTTGPFSRGSLYLVSWDGSKWSLDPSPHSASSFSYASPISATASARGDVVATWATANALEVQLELGQNRKAQILQHSCCAYHPNIVADTTQIAVGWFSNEKDQFGQYTQTVLPSIGQKFYLPGSADKARKSALTLSQRMALGARLGAEGIYAVYCAGYPTCTTVNVIRHGEAQPVVLAKGQGVRLVSITPGPEGRLWVMWNRGTKLNVVRSNKAVSRWSAPSEIDAPKGATTVWTVAGEGSNGPLDAVVSADVTGEGLAFWQTQIFPTMTVTATPQSLSGAEGGTITVQVTDLGDAVAGAQVTLAGQTATSNAAGKALLHVAKASKPATQTVKVSHRSYKPASTTVVVKQ
jgi:hypothetical protein